MEAVIFLSIIIALFSILVSCFAIRRVKKQIAEITDALIDVKNGNGNRRILSATNELVAPLAYIIVGFPGVHFGNLLNMFIRVTGANIGIYISVLPIILIFCCSANNFLGGVALAFVYGYFGTFEGTLLNYYPIKASMILVDPTCGAEYGYTYHIFPAFITIVLTFLISMIILANKKKEPGTLTVGKKKKAVRKKGW